MKKNILLLLTVFTGLLFAAPTVITPSTETLTINATSKEIASHPDRVLPFTFTSATRAASVPPSAGRVGFETDTGTVYYSTGVSAGDWARVSPEPTDTDPSPLAWIARDAQTVYLDLEDLTNRLGDSSGHGGLTQVGTVTYGSHTTLGRVATFDGLAGNYLEADTTVDLRTNGGDWWVRGAFNCDTLNRGIISHSDFNDLRNDFTLRTDVSGNLILSITRPGTTSIDSVTSSHVVGIGADIHFCIEFSQTEGQIRLHVNGVTNSLRTSFNCPDALKPLRIGCDYHTGTSATIGNYFDGHISYIVAGLGKVNPDITRTHGIHKGDVEDAKEKVGAGLYIGDSLIRSTHVIRPEVNLQEALQADLGIGGRNYGIGGETSSQIKARVDQIPLADFYMRRVVIWVGNNNSGDLTQVLADTASIYARAKAGGALNVVVCGLTNRYLPTDLTATVIAKNDEVNAINAVLNTTYGGEFLDMQGILGTLQSLNPDVGTQYVLTNPAYRDTTSPEKRHYNEAGDALIAASLAPKLN